MQIGAAIKRHPGRTAILTIALLAIGGFGIYWFGPQYLFLDTRVEEALPGVGAPVGEAPADDAVGRSDQTVTLAMGEFRSLEHGTSGTALIVELEDGSRYLRLEDLDTSNGPDLRVILSSTPAPRTNGAPTTTVRSSISGA